MDAETAFKLIDKLSIFSEFTEKEKGFISKLDSQVLRYAPTETIIKEVDKGCHFYVLLEGVVEVHRGKSSTTKIAELKPGNVFGEISYLSK